MSQFNLPSSFYYTLVSFALFFGSLNIFIFTEWLNHPLKSPLWVALTLVGLVALVYSWRMVRIQQDELVKQTRKQDQSRE